MSLVIAEVYGGYQAASGINARYFRITQKTGMKIFQDVEVRDATYLLQKEASLCGVGPKIYDKFEFTTLFGRERYGYITEHINRIYKDICKAKGIDDCWCYDIIKKINRLEDKYFRATGKYLDDLHWGNVGFTDRDRLVCIDFMANFESS